MLLSSCLEVSELPVNILTQLEDKDVLNIDEYDYHCQGSLYVFVDHGFICGALLYDGCLQDVLDEACDYEIFDRWQVSEEEFTNDYDSNEDSLMRIGNASELFDLESMGFYRLPVPELSIVKLLRK